MQQQKMQNMQKCWNLLQHTAIPGRAKQAYPKGNTQKAL